MNNNVTTMTRWPAEWEKHAATWMAFPCRREIWTDGLESAQNAYAKVANLISEYEPLNMLIRAEHTQVARKKLSSSIRLIELGLDDSWARDTAPIWVFQSDQLKGLDFQFNAWGNKFFPFDNDAKIAQQVCSLANTHCEKIDLVLEGGSIHSNGKGTLMTTKECLLNSNRNPGLTQREIESVLASSLGVKSFIWLENGIVGDFDTDGHIDNIACFADEQTVLTQRCEKVSENYSIYQANKSIVNESGFELVEISEPQASYSDGNRLPLSYINFYLANGAVILPQFGCQQDGEALSVMTDLFPERKIHPVDANPILVGGGGIHCITMQQPLLENK